MPVRSYLASLGRLVALITIVSLNVLLSPARGADPEPTPAIKPPAGAVFLEAESLHMDAGWTVRPYALEDGYHGYPSRLKLLSGVPDSVGAATASVLVPHAGRFRLWVRCNANLYAPFTVSLIQGGKTVVSADFTDKTSRAAEEADKPWGSENRLFVWWSLDADLAQGPCTLQVSHGRVHPAYGSPWLDCFVLTGDLAYRPLIWQFAPQLYLRVRTGPRHNPLGGVVYFWGRINYQPYFCGRGHITKAGFDAILNAFDDNPKKYLFPGSSSPWVNIGPSLDPRGDNRLRFEMLSGWYRQLPDADFAIDLATAPDGPPIRSFHRAGKGCGLVVILDPRHPEKARSSIEWSADALQAARRLPVPPRGKAPVKFPVFSGLNDYSASDPDIAMRNDLLTLRALGCTGSSALYDDIAWLKQQGLPQLFLTSFCFHLVTRTGCLNAPDAAAMKAQFADVVGKYVHANQPVPFCRLMDEIYSVDFAHMKSCPVCIAKFRATLKGQGETLETLIPGLTTEPGRDPWDAIIPTDDKKAAPRLFYFSKRFQCQTLVDFFKTATAALQAVKPDLRTAANPSIEFTYGRNALERGVDIFELYRSGALTYGYAEDANSAMPSGQTLDFIMDCQRSACKYTGQPFGSYTIGTCPGWDMQAKAFAQLGHGAGLVYFYDYGPYHSDSSDPQSQRPEFVAAMKSFNYALGAVENHLLGAQVSQSRIALVYAPTTDIWSSTWEEGFVTGSGSERVYLYLLLRHLGYPVDIVTEDDILEGRADGYRAIFLVESHLKEGVAAKLLAWVHGGGFLYAGAGAASFGRFNEPAPGLEASGLKRGAFAYDGKSGWWPQSLSVADRVTAGGKVVEAAGGKQPAAVDSAGAVLLRFADGAPAAVTLPVGKGQLLYVGFFPGTSYVRGANLKEQVRRTAIEKAKQQYATYCASWYPEEYRAMMKELLRPLGYVPPVRVSHYLVEANLLAGKSAQVLALVNWTGTVQRNVRVSVDLPFTPGTPFSAVATPREIRRAGHTLSFTIDVGPGDFIVVPPARK